MITHTPDLKSGRAYIYLTILVCICLTIISYYYTPSLYFNPKPWAEMATNYYYTSQNLSFFEGFKIKDFTYIPFLPRLLSQIWGNLLNGVWFMVALKLSALLITLFTLFHFTNKKFSAVISNDLLRVLLPTMLYTISGFELKTPINFTYFGFFFCLYILQYSSANKSPKLKQYENFLFFAFCSSKPVFVILAPLLLVMIIKKKNPFLYSISLCAIIVQIGILGHSTLVENLNFYSDSEITLPEKIISTLTYAPMYFAQTFLGASAFNTLLSLGNFFPSALGLLVLAGIQKWNKNSLIDRKVFYITIYVLFAVSFLNSFGQTKLINLDFSNANYRVWRVNWAAICASLFFLFHITDRCILNSTKKQRRVIYFIVLLHFISMGKQNFTITDNSYEHFFKNVNWDSENLKKVGCLPIAPPPWEYCSK